MQWYRLNSPGLIWVRTWTHTLWTLIWTQYSVDSDLCYGCWSYPSAIQAWADKQVWGVYVCDSSLWTQHLKFYIGARVFFKLLPEGVILIIFYPSWFQTCVWVRKVISEGVIFQNSVFSNRKWEICETPSLPHCHVRLASTLVIANFAIIF